LIGLTTIDGDEIADGAGNEAESSLERREAYIRTSANSQCAGYVKKVRSEGKPFCMPTGFSKLDAELEGGLPEGLCVLGGASSVGKTTFTLQIGDQIAQSGADVLAFSLETARGELMAKSLSRETAKCAMRRHGNAQRAMTQRGISDGGRYAGYGEEELRLIDEAVESYGRYPGNVFIEEKIGGLTVEDICIRVETHLAITGRRPFVIIDYLQILAPHSERMTDKQNVDRAVLKLKKISGDFHIPVMAISSYNRQSYKKEAAMEAFKESGEVEYSSDVLLGLQIAGAGRMKGGFLEAMREEPRKTELLVLKNRGAGLGAKIAFEYFANINYFKECEAFPEIAKPPAKTPVRRSRKG
jgi:replicative DNA helicase